MSLVYVVEECEPYEGSWLVSIWTTEEAANKEVEKLKKRDEPYSGYYSVTEYEINSSWTDTNGY